MFNKEYFFEPDSSLTDTTKNEYDKYRPSKRPTYKPKDRYNDNISNRPSKSPFYKPLNTQTKVEVDTSLKYYYVDEKLGDMNYRPSTAMTYDEYQKFKQKETSRNFWKGKSKEKDEKSTETNRALIPKIYINPGLDRIFGGNTVDIKPNGSILLDFGGQWQTTNNPAIPVRFRTVGGFRFDQQIQLNLSAKIGTKLKLTANQDTRSQFDFDNNIKLEYTAGEEDIIQKIDAGNVTMPINSSLIQGSNNLFGIKTILKFGKLNVTAVVANQRGAQQQQNVTGGAQTKNFEVRADQYEDNRHYFLSQYFRDNYERALQTAPMVNSGYNILRVEVYRTNYVGSVDQTRSIIGFADLGEDKPNSINIQFEPLTPNVIRGQKNPINIAPDNYVNNLYRRLPKAKDQDSSLNNVRTNPSLLESGTFNLRQGVDYEALNVTRRLKDSEFKIHQQLGYISLNSPLSRDEVLAVSYVYTDNKGNIYRVGELQEDYGTVSSRRAIFLKLLKGQSIRTNIPMWDLQMKNIYNLNSSQVSREGFQLRVIYKDDVSQVDNPSLNKVTDPPMNAAVKGVPLLQLMNLDRLNMSNDPQRDGNFDFLESATNNTTPIPTQNGIGGGQSDNQNNLNSNQSGTLGSTQTTTNFNTSITIDPAFGRIIFPVLEPFGSHLRSKFGSDINNADFYAYDELYTSTKADALQKANKNKFFIKGRLQSVATNNEIQLQGFGLQKGDVIVTSSAGVILIEGSDYRIDYQLAKLTIINAAYLLPGQEVKISYAKNDLFQIRQKQFVGARFDYALNKDVSVGGTFLRMSERPTITRVNIGDEPATNILWGADANYKSDSRLITKILDKLPFYSTKEKSTVTAAAEFASLHPGASRLINKDGGTVFIDDFENTDVQFALGQPNSWKIGSTPKNLYPSFTDSLAAGYRRAKLAHYTIDPTFFSGTTGLPGGITSEDMQNHYVRAIDPQAIYPGRDRQQLTINQPTFDLAFYPEEKGPYNYNTDLTSKGLLKNPKNNFGAITRAVNQYDTDYDNANYQYLEFWLLDPFIDDNNKGVVLDGRVNKRNTTGGKLQFHLGSVSEDVLPNDQQEFEQGLPPTPERPNPKFVDKNIWGYVTNQTYVTDAFAADPNARVNQDVGLDGMDNQNEANHFNQYLQSIRSSAVLIDSAKNAIIGDPSNDDFKSYLGPDNDSRNLKVLERYKRFNNMEGNSTSNNNGNNTTTSSAYNTPDNEDISKNNTLDRLEEYFEYNIDLSPTSLEVGKNFIVSKTIETNNSKATWYLFRVPLREGYNKAKANNPENFKSIRFLRTVLTGWQEPVVLRMSDMKMSSSTWRTYKDDLKLKKFGLPSEPNDKVFTVSTVNIEENGQGDPNNRVAAYVLPPDFQRDIDNTANNNRRLNEHSLRLCVNGLESEDARAVFKNFDLNLINYKEIKMFVSAQSSDITLNDNDMTAFMRIGTDFTDNYYEIEVPLRFLTDYNNYSANNVWNNTFDFSLNQLADLKMRRNNDQNVDPSSKFFLLYPSYTTPTTQGQRFFIKGNPDFSSVQTVMIGIRNPTGRRKNTCIWINEFRAAGFEKQAGMAATARVNLKLADLANVSGTMKYTTSGFGGLDTKISQRLRQNTLIYGLTGNINTDKIIPKSWGLKLPVFMSYDRQNIAPEFDPLNPDIKLKRIIDNLPSDEKSNYKKLVEDNTTRRTISFNNIQKVKTKQNAKPHIWDISNFTFNFGYSDVHRTNVNTQNYTQKNYKSGAAWGYSPKPLEISPFKKIKFLNKKATKIIGDINFNPIPSTMTVRADLDRTIAQTQFSNGIKNGQHDTVGILPTFEKRFLFNRSFTLGWNLTKSIALNYSATVSAIIDEPEGKIDESLVRNGFTKKDSVKKNILSGGRMKNFNQNIGLNYKVPLDKIPLINWIQADARYSTSYIWNAGSVGISDSLGNNAANNSEKALNTKFDFLKLYNKSKFLQKINNPPQKAAFKPKPKPLISDTSLKNKQAKKDTTKRKLEYKSLKYLARLMMSLRNVNGTYALQEGTVLPNFKGTPKYLGLDLNQFENISNNNYWMFVAGGQDQSIYKDPAFADRYMSSSTSVNNFVTKNKTESITGRATLEPLKDFRIQLDARVSHTKNYQEFFKIDTIGQGFKTLSPYLSGNYTMSYTMIETAFDKFDKDLNTASFTRFIENRNIIAKRLNAENPFASANKRYDTSSQDVLIPAFIAAYRDQSPDKIKTTAFPKIPIPNWRIDYAGLGNIPAVKKYFTSIAISHSYTSSYSINQYIGNTIYGDKYINIKDNPESNKPNIADSNNVLIPTNIIGSISMSERFSPLIGVNMRTKNNVSLRFEYQKERNLTLNLTNSQVLENSSSGFTIGAGYTKGNLKLPFKSKGRDIILKNDITFRLDVTRRQSIIIQRKTNGINTPTSGQINYQFRPNIAYQYNKRLNFQFYFERTVNQPRVSNQFYRSTTSFGLQLRYSLS